MALDKLRLRYPRNIEKLRWPGQETGTSNPVNPKLSVISYQPFTTVPCLLPTIY